MAELPEHKQPQMQNGDKSHPNSKGRPPHERGGNERVSSGGRAQNQGGGFSRRGRGGGRGGHGRGKFRTFYPHGPRWPHPPHFQYGPRPHFALGPCHPMYGQGYSMPPQMYAPPMMYVPPQVHMPPQVHGPSQGNTQKKGKFNRRKGKSPKKHKKSFKRPRNEDHSQKKVGPKRKKRPKEPRNKESGAAETKEENRTVVEAGGKQKAKDEQKRKPVKRKYPTSPSSNSNGQQSAQKVSKRQSASRDEKPESDDVDSKEAVDKGVTTLTPTGTTIADLPVVMNSSSTNAVNLENAKDGPSGKDEAKDDVVKENEAKEDESGQECKSWVPVPEEESKVPPHTIVQNLNKANVRGKRKWGQRRIVEDSPSALPVDYPILTYAKIKGPNLLPYDFDNMQFVYPLGIVCKSLDNILFGFMVWVHNEDFHMAKPLVDNKKFQIHVFGGNQLETLVDSNVIRHAWYVRMRSYMQMMRREISYRYYDTILMSSPQSAENLPDIKKYANCCMKDAEWALKEFFDPVTSMEGVEKLKGDTLSVLKKMERVEKYAHEDDVKALTKQMEFYLSDKNMPNDNHLLKLINKNTYLPFEDLKRWQLMRQIHSTERVRTTMRRARANIHILCMHAIRKSDKLKLAPNLEGVNRIEPLTEEIVTAYRKRHVENQVYLKGLRGHWHKIQMPNLIAEIQAIMGLYFGQVDRVTICWKVKNTGCQRVTGYFRVLFHNNDDARKCVEGVNRGFMMWELPLAVVTREEFDNHPHALHGGRHRG